jgi:hypothetical protein
MRSTTDDRSVNNNEPYRSIVRSFDKHSSRSISLGVLPTYRRGGIGFYIHACPPTLRHSTPPLVLRVMHKAGREAPDPSLFPLAPTTSFESKPRRNIPVRDRHTTNQHRSYPLTLLFCIVGNGAGWDRVGPRSVGLGSELLLPTIRRTTILVGSNQTNAGQDTSRRVGGWGSFQRMGGWIDPERERGGGVAAAAGPLRDDIREEEEEPPSYEWSSSSSSSKSKGYGHGRTYRTSVRTCLCALGGPHSNNSRMMSRGGAVALSPTRVPVCVARAWIGPINGIGCPVLEGRGWWVGWMDAI